MHYVVFNTNEKLPQNAKNHFEKINKKQNQKITYYLNL